MCYTNIKPAETPKKKFYWKIVQVGEKGGYYGLFTYLFLPKNRWIKALNFGGVNRTPRSLPSSQSQHSYTSNFKGFGVFLSKKSALKYLGIWSSCAGDWNTAIIKVQCNGDVRKATTESWDDDGIPAVPCYIFDKIKIVE